MFFGPTVVNFKQWSCRSQTLRSDHSLTSKEQTLYSGFITFQASRTVSGSLRFCVLHRAHPVRLSTRRHGWNRANGGDGCLFSRRAWFAVQTPIEQPRYDEEDYWEKIE
jgi:hypothetical protein